MATHLYGNPAPVVATSSTSNETYAARTRAAAGTATAEEIAAAERAHDEELARQKAAEEAEAAKIVEEARHQINEATAAAIADQIPKVVENAQFIIDKSKLCKETRDGVLRVLGTLFPNFDNEPWLELGSEEYMARRLENLKTVRDGFYRKQSHNGDYRVNPSDQAWDDYAPKSQTDRLPTEVLRHTSVLSYLWQKDVSAGNGAGPYDTSYYWTSGNKWSWVSELDTTFSSVRVPDFGAFYTSRLGAFVQNFFEGSAEFQKIQSCTSATECGKITVNKMWPHGWLTTLETAMAICGYYTQAADQSLLMGINLRSGPSYRKRYSLFTEGDIRHLQGQGDPQVGWESIMDANHSNLRSWTKGGKLPYNPNEETTGKNTPENFVLRSFQEAKGKTCGAGVWQISSNWTSTTEGVSSALEELRPFSLLRGGGPLAQGIFNSQWTWSEANENASRCFDKYTYAKFGIIKHLSKKLRADADRFRTLHDVVRNYKVGEKLDTQQLAVLALLGEGFAASGGGTITSMSGEPMREYALKQISELSDRSIFRELSNMLNSLASFVDGTLDEIDAAHQEIKESHRVCIDATCDAINEVAGAFNDDDSWYNPFDDHDDFAEAATRASVGNPFDNVSATMIGTGATNVMFKEQCFLLSFITDFAITKMRNLDRGSEAAPATKRLPYVADKANIKSLENNATLLMDGGSYGFLNKLTQNPKLERFYNALNHELSNLQPKIRLWKVIFDDEGNEQEIPIKFESHFSAADLDMFKNSAARGVGTGLKSFNFTYDGSNPFSVKKSIKANLKIFATSMSEILRDRPSHYIDDQGKMQSTTYRFSDLAMKTWNTRNEPGKDTEEESEPFPCGTPAFDVLSENTEKSELNFRLKAEVGFSQPLNKMSSMSEDLREALAESFVTLNLTPTVHNFEIDEMGRVIFNLNYLAYIEQFFDQSMFNVFSSSNIAIKRMHRELLMKYYNTVDCSPDQISDQKERFAEEVKKENEQAIASLIGDMMTENLIYYVNLPYSKITSFLSYGPHRTRQEFLGEDISIRSNAAHNQYLKKRVENALASAFGDEGESAFASEGEDEQNKIQAALLGNDPREADLSFFYLSDLIDLILLKIENGLKETVENLDDIGNLQSGHLIACEEKLAKRKDLLNALKNFKKLRIMLGPMELTHPEAQDGKTSIHVNLGDCPISVKYFLEWLTNKMLQKDEVSYNLTKFVNDLINNLIRNFLNNDQCFGYSVKQKTRLNQSAISSYGVHKKYDPVTLGAMVAQKRGQTQQVREARAGLATEIVVGSITSRGAVSDALHRAQARGAAKKAMNDPDKSFRTHMDNYSMPILNPSGPSDSARTSIPVSNEYNYFVYFAGRVMPTELMKGIKASDEENFGIFHYILGRDRGLVKNIKLTKTQTKGLAEVRFEQSGYDGLQQLRVTYDAQVDMFASVNTFPGTYIYIDPRGFAPEGSGDENFSLTSLGIGGYYMIVRSEHEFAEGKANTILHTKWVNQVDAEGEEAERQQIAESSSGTGDMQSRKCNIKLRPEPTPEVPESGGFLGMFGL